MKLIFHLYIDERFFTEKTSSNGLVVPYKELNYTVAIILFMVGKISWLYFRGREIFSQEPLIIPTKDRVKALLYCPAKNIKLSSRGFLVFGFNFTTVKLHY